MAFDNKGYKVQTTKGTVYTATSTITIVTLNIANIHATETRYVKLTWYDGTTEFVLHEKLGIPHGSSFIFEKVFFLKTTQYLSAQIVDGGSNDDIHITLELDVE